MSVHTARALSVLPDRAPARTCARLADEFEQLVAAPSVHADPLP
jgi:hypothetical protein